MGMSRDEFIAGSGGKLELGNPLPSVVELVLGLALGAPLGIEGNSGRLTADVAVEAAEGVDGVMLGDGKPFWMAEF
jgi:hypothetical protein